MRAIALHTYAGGSLVGVKDAGWRVTHVVEPDGFGLEVMDTDFLQVAPQQVMPDLEVDMVFGNPACAGFSMMNNQHRGINSPSNADLRRFWELAPRGGSPVIVMESVPGAFLQGRQLIEDLCPDGYRMEHVLVNHGRVGGSQKRRRYWAVAHRLGSFFTDPIGWHPESPSVALSGAREAQGGQIRPRSPRLARTERLAAITPAGTPLRTKARELAEHYPELLRDIDGIQPWARGSSTNLMDHDRVVHPHLPAHTVTGVVQHYHWADGQVLSIREVARLMDLPDEWRLPEDMSPVKVWSRLGKNVPAKSARWIASQVAANLAGETDGMVPGVDRVHMRDRDGIW